MQRVTKPIEEQTTEDFHDHQVIKVDKGQNPLRIDKFLTNRLVKITRNRLQSAIRSGAVLVNNKEVKPNFKVKAGQEISILLPKSNYDSSRIVPQDIPLDIVYEDDDLLLVNKKAGMVVHPGIGHKKGTLVNALAHHLGYNEVNVPDGNFQERLGLVHRIDKNTSGLLVVAKNEYALSHLAKQFFHHTIERTYYALAWGEPEEPKGSINGHIGRHPRFPKKFTVFPQGDKGKWAITHYEVIEPMYYVSLVKCNLETGRTHQIRVHMKHIGHPLFNDEKYGGDHIIKGTIFSKYKMFVENCFTLMPRHGLHAKSLGFVHPKTGEHMQFDSELPSDFTEVLDKWRRYVGARKKQRGSGV